MNVGCAKHRDTTLSMHIHIQYNSFTRNDGIKSHVSSYTNDITHFQRLR